MLKHLFLMTLLAALATGPVSADDKVLPKGSYNLLGRWCDEMLPLDRNFNRVIEIQLLKDGSAVLQYELQGTIYVNALVDAGDALFKKVDSDFGDMYRIVPNNGELQLLDDEGYIRTAKRLENVPQPGDCLP